MIADVIARQGNWLFRWRSYVVLGFAPLFLLAISRPEPIEVAFGTLADSLYEGACILLAFVGLAVRAATVGFVPAGTSGRNTHYQIARTLNTTGMYSVTRNPIYLGNAITTMAVTLFTQDLALVLLMLMFQIIYLERIIATEEKFLTESFGAQYREWAERVPVFFPRFSGWTAPSLRFSLKSVLRRECSSFFAVVVLFFALDQAREVLAEHSTEIDPFWLSAFVAGAAIYLGLVWMKKRTTLLNVSGR